MGEPKNRWSWEVPGFEPRKSFEFGDEQSDRPPAPPARRYSLSAATLPRAEVAPRRSLSVKIQKLKEQVSHARKEYLELRQEASDLQEYSNAKLDRVTRYLGVLAERARKLDQAAFETQAKISPLILEKKKLFNDLLTAKGNIKVFCRTRPQFEDEGPSIAEFPDDYTIRISLANDTVATPKRDFEFDRVYGPHVGQGELFQDVQPFVRSAFDGYNVSLLAYGQARSGKTYTMEGSNHERGLYMRCFEELFDLSNSDSPPISKYKFYVTMFELYNEQVRDLLLSSGIHQSKVCMGSPDSFAELVQEKAENPVDLSRILKTGIDNRGADVSRCRVSHLVVTIHIQNSMLVTGETMYSKLSLVDLAGSDGVLDEGATGERVTDFIHVMKSLSALGDVLSALTTKKDVVPYKDSKLTELLSDSLGGSSNTLVIVNICPNHSTISETLSSLNFSARSRSAELSLGNRDTIKKWRDVANDSRRELYEKERENQELKQEIMFLKKSASEANDQCLLLFNEVQKAWKVSFTLQADLKTENTMLMDKQKVEKEQNSQLRNQVAYLLQLEQDQKKKIREQDSLVHTLQAKIKNIECQLEETLQSSGSRSMTVSESDTPGTMSTSKDTKGIADPSEITRKLEQELSKRDELIERLHEENEKLFDRLTEKSSYGGAAKVSSPASRSIVGHPVDNLNRREATKGLPTDVASLRSESERFDGSVALVKSGPDKGKSTPAGEYLTAALTEFDPDQYDSLATIADGANKLLMLVLAAVIKAGAAREHEILAEIRDAVFSFIRKMEPKRVMDTMLVSRVRILYIRSLLARSPELQSIKVSPVERFLEKAHSGRSRSSSRGSSPGRSPVHYDSGYRTSIIDEHVHGFKVNIKQEKKSKFSSIVLKLRGIDQETWRQHVTGGKLREITEEAKNFAIGNKALAALFVHTPAGELQRQIRTWLAENFEFLSVTDGDGIGGGSGQLELLSTAIMDGWMAGLGSAQRPSTDALGQLLSEYTKRVYTSQLQHLKDIAGTLATEEAEDSAQVNKLRSALESVDHKRRKILQQLQSDSALLSKEGGSPIRNPSTAVEDARLASLISLDGILKQVKDIASRASQNVLTKSKKRTFLASLDELSEQMPSLLDIDQSCALRHIADARSTVESVTEQDDNVHGDAKAFHVHQSENAVLGMESHVTQWNVLQFNTGSTTPFIIKCGANSSSELVVKADAKVQGGAKGSEIVRVVPRPSVLTDMGLEEMKQLFEQLPEAISLLALARTADGTRARYSRLYRTLAMKVPSLRNLVVELEKGGALKDVKS
ncbi:Kinesin-like protein [Nymphaea thermarum]|nr:Kinesin-like protein [Nymphaea thermarum]